MSRPYASVSLDLDNLWSYQKTHGDPGWEELPSYLDVLVDRALPIFAERGWRITFFIVGQDAALERNAAALERIAAEGHEIGNHSFHHEPWLHRYGDSQLEDEIALAEEAIITLSGSRPVGFRGPGFSCSPALLDLLQRRGYLYDASTLPTWLGPLARKYYFATAELTPEERAERAALFGSLRDVLRPVKPYRWRLQTGELLEIPVTTMPLWRVPFHLSYVLYLSTYSTLLATTFFRTALLHCRLLGVNPSLLLHPLDFLGGDEIESLRFFPAMQMAGEIKRSRMKRWLDLLAQSFEVINMREHVRRVAESDRVALRDPEFSFA
jgi:peptidoglycan/xylan/chitin deacetylase (PgdA/CDA1 family)